MNKKAPARASLSEPYFLFLLFVALGLGTLMLRQSLRQALLWSTLALLGVLYRGSQKVEMSFTLASVGRGLLLGLVIAVPLLAFLSEPLRAFNESLYGTSDVVYLFYQVCFVSAPVEEYFFRGVVQQRRGLSVSVALYGAAVLLLFLPHVPLLVALLVLIAMGVLSLAYGYIAEKHGFSAALTCRLVVALLVQVFPSLFVILRQLFA